MATEWQHRAARQVVDERAWLDLEPTRESQDRRQSWLSDATLHAPDCGRVYPGGGGESILAHAPIDSNRAQAAAKGHARSTGIVGERGHIAHARGGMLVGPEGFGRERFGLRCATDASWSLCLDDCRPPEAKGDVDPDASRVLLWLRSTSSLCAAAGLGVRVNGGGAC